MRIVIASIIVAGVLSSASPGSAQIEGKTKLGLGVDMLSFASYDNDLAGPANTVIGVGPFAPSVYQSVIGVPPIGLDLGYGVSETVVIGALIRLGVSSIDEGAGDSITSTAVGLLAHVDYVLSPQSSFRPFVGALAGVSLLGGDGALGNNESLTFANVGLELGGYGFVGNSLSVGPRLLFTYNPGLSNAAENMSVLAVQLQLEIAGWM